MNPLSRLALAGPVAQTVSDAIESVIPNSPILRSGAAAVGLRYAMRSIPVALAVIGAGFAIKAFTKKDQPSTPAKRAARKSTAKSSPRGSKPKAATA